MQVWLFFVNNFYKGVLVKYARNNQTYVQKLEKMLSEFIAEGRDKLDYKFDKKEIDKVRFQQIFLPKHYKLEVAYCKIGISQIFSNKKIRELYIGYSKKHTKFIAALC